jgi:hypothetical protein
MSTTKYLESTDEVNTSNKVESLQNIILQPGQVLLPDGRLLKKADPNNRRDHRMVDGEGNTVLTEKYLKQLCKEQGGYQTPELNDKIYLHFKGSQKC